MEPLGHDLVLVVGTAAVPTIVRGRTNKSSDEFSDNQSHHLCSHWGNSFLGVLPKNALKPTFRVLRQATVRNNKQIGPQDQAGIVRLQLLALIGSSTHTVFGTSRGEV